MRVPDSVKNAARRILQRRKWAYIHTFEPPVARDVLTDLARFCRANETTYQPDARLHAVLEGRREVWLRIARHLNLDDEQLWQLYGPHDRGN